MGSTAIKAPGGSKEGDSTFKPLEFRPHKHDWPTLVVECGVSEPLSHLVNDAYWWLLGSRGEVKLVVLIFVSESDKHVHIEKWELVTGKNKRITRANPHSFRDIPTQTHELDIVGDVVTGAPLRLEFEKIMLRQPSSEEGDIIFGTQDLKRLASFVWRSTQ
ncbi:hypothetical protein HOY82DRAFT_510605 [Tuber indicum]|nr:hypothetical protein HOY82DRAFT_510605 [Tuber indicum]